MPQLDGRVFSRQQQYDALPTELKDEVSALVDYLTTNQHDVFGFHHANLLKSVRSVRAKPLTEKITAWLLHKELATSETVVDASETVVDTETKIEETPAATEEIKPAEEDKPAEDKPAEATETPAADAAPAPTAEEAAKAKEDAKAAALQAKEEAAAKTKAEQEAQAARLAHAKKLLEALVLKGFVTPYKESEKILTTPLTGPETFTFKDSELFVPLAAEVAAEPVAAPAAASTPPQEASASVDQSASVEQSDAKPAEENATPAPATPPTTPAPLPTTVWDLVDGAVFAAVLKRKAGFLAPLTQGKDTYVVVNARSRSLTLFESDLGRQPIVEFGYEGTTAAFDKPHFVHGVKIWNDTITELLNANTKLEREALVHSLLGIGITYHEDLAPGLDKLETIYSLKDTDIDGQEITFDKYKGKVLLIVNVSSKCGLTPTNYPELVTLYDKYHEQGLEVLAFPCNQFMGQEPGTHDEIKAFVAQYNASFPFFSKGDVNGVDARPVFAYLKHKLPGPYIQWNFAKFLVDRNGVPVKRFGPQELPLSFEGEIVKLLAEEAKPEVVETPATTETTEVVAEAAVATTEAEAAPAVEAAVEAPPAVEAAVEAPPAAVEETKAPAPAPAEPTPAPVEEDKAAEPTPEAAPAEETAAPADPVKPAPAPVTPEAPAVVETKVEMPAAVEAPAPAVEQKIEAVAAAPPAPSEEPTPALKQAPASDTNQHEADVPAQGFTPGNEPTSAP